MSRTRKAVGWVLVALGAVAAVAGTAVLVGDGQVSCSGDASVCAATSGAALAFLVLVGLVLLVFGLALLGVGVVVLRWRRSRPPAPGEAP